MTLQKLKIQFLYYNKSFNYFPISVNIKHKSNVVPFKHVIKMISIIFTYACFKSGPKRVDDNLLRNMFKDNDQGDSGYTPD